MIAAAVAGTEVIVALAFMLLEERNRHLVKIGEAALAALQDRLAEAADVPELRMVAAADHRLIGWKRLAKYSWVVRGVMASGVLLMCVAFAAAIISATTA